MPLKSPRTRVKKKKPHTLTWWRKTAWRAFSAFIRARDRYTCFCCGRRGEGGAIHAGHFLTGATCPPSLYFSEKNVHAQCYNCNINLSGNWPVYEERMIHRYGAEFVNELKKERWEKQGEKWGIEEYQKILEKYTPTYPQVKKKTR